MRSDGYTGLGNFLRDKVADQADAAHEPVGARIENQIEKPRYGHEPDVAGVSELALLPRRHRGIFVYGDDVQRPAIFIPVAVGRMMMQMMLRPHILRHAGYDAENKSEHLVETRSAEQAAVTAFVHQHKNAQQEEA